MSTKTEPKERVSHKNTKEQILSAYHELADEIEGQKGKKQTPQEEKKARENQEVLKAANSNSVEDITGNISTLQVSITQALDKLNENLVREFKKFELIQAAIKIEQSHIEELYGIKETAHSFAAILAAQEEQRSKFLEDMEKKTKEAEQDFAEKKDSFEKKKLQLANEYKELKEKLEKEHKRSEEEYGYDLEIKRRKETDDYEARKAKLEEELENKRKDVESRLSQREEVLKTKEQEFGQLQARVATFKEELEKAVTEAENRVRTELETRHTFHNDMEKQKAEGTIALLKQKIASLEDKIKEQDATVTTLARKSDDAAKQVQDIACRALDASTHRFPYPSYIEKSVPVNQDGKERKTGS